MTITPAATYQDRTRCNALEMQSAADVFRDYLVIVWKKETIHHEGDQRSRDCPGHGYPAYTETISTPKIYGCQTMEDVETVLRVAISDNCTYSIAKVTPMSAHVKLELVLSPTG